MYLKGNCVIAQSGGPTSVINSSALGVITEAMKHEQIKGIYSAENGILGVLDQRYFDLRKEDPDILQGFLSTPSSALGSNRYKIKTQADLKSIIQSFKKFNIRYFFYIGGNDSMDTADKIQKLSVQENYDLRVMGIPKTIDNDLFGTDHCPGYGSVIKYLSVLTMEVAKDTEAMRTHEPVSVIEAMGRNTGWIAAGSALSRREEHDAPHIILLPEVQFQKEKFLKKVTDVLEQNKFCTIVVSEGTKTPEGNYIAEEKGNFSTDAFGHKQLGGAGLFIRDLVEQEVKVKARYVIPSLAQRGAVHFASLTDSDEAFQAGREAVRLAFQGRSGLMTVYNRISDHPYQISMGSVPLSEVANGEHLFPHEWISEDGFFVTQEFIHYALPLIRGQLTLNIKDGLPVFSRLKGYPVKPQGDTK